MPDPNDPLPPDVDDPVIAVYLKDVDRSLLRENLKLTPTERLVKAARAAELFRELRHAGELQRQNNG